MAGACGATRLGGKHGNSAIRLHTAMIAPDADPERGYMNTLIDDAIAVWEGVARHHRHGVSRERLLDVGKTRLPSSLLSATRSALTITTGGGEATVG